MALKVFHLGLVAIFAMTLWSVASAQSTSSCMSTIISLSPCLSYITGNASTPTSSCCTQLASVVSSKPECLCMVLNNGVPSLGITINKTKALQLPVDCKVKTPPVSRCKDIAGGGGASGSAAAPSPSSMAAGDVGVVEEEVDEVGNQRTQMVHVQRRPSRRDGLVDEDYEFGSSTGSAAAPGPSSNGSSV